MNIFSVFTLCGGLAFFLYGMSIMSSGLEKMTGGKLEILLKKMTSNPIKSLVLGAGITIAIQSSSALTVMLVGLVNSGIMQLGQTIGVIMGSNIGTTLTAWLLSLTGIDSDNVFINLLKPESFSPLLALIGILLIMTSKTDSRKSFGSILMGFSVLMYGMEFMKNAMAPLAEMPQFTELMTAFNNPLLGVLTGTVVTGVIQSSAASVGILQALSMTGSITFGMAIPIIMGQNIGTCATALISSIGVNKSAKRVAVVHISFNLIGTAICLVVFYGLNAVLHFEIVNEPITPFGIAVVHSVFNIVTTVILLPFTKLLEKIALVVIKDSDKKEQFSFIDERLIATPSVAVEESRIKMTEMAEIAEKCILMALNTVPHYRPENKDKILEYEDALDMYEDRMGTFLVELSGKELSVKDSTEVSKHLHIIGDFERIGDHAVSLVRSTEELYEKKLSFSDAAKKELAVLNAALVEILSITTRAFENGDAEMASRVEPLEQVIDKLIAKAKNKHIERLQAGACTIEMGFILSDILANMSRVSDHCSNIAVSVIDMQNNVHGPHEYLNAVKYSGDPDFEKSFAEFSKKYGLE